MKTYRPLPKSVEILKSPIDGHGLFAREDIPKGTELGITHVRDERFQDGYIRTPLGGFFNHSEEPNCQAYLEGAEFICLRALRDIQEGEELTAHYWLYELSP